MATFSYSATRGSDLDRARELLGATAVTVAAESGEDDPGEALRSDEDITAVLGREGFTRGVAWLAAGLLAQFAQQPVRLSSSGESIDFTDRLKAWEKLAEPLRRDLALDGAQAPPAATARTGAITAGQTAARKLR